MRTSRSLLFFVFAFSLVLAANPAPVVAVGGSNSPAVDEGSGPERFASLPRAVDDGALDARVERAIQRGSTRVLVSFRGDAALARAVSNAPHGRTRTESIVSSTSATYRSLKQSAFAEVPEVDVIRDYDVLPLAFVDVPSESSLLDLLNRPEVVGIGPNVKMQANLTQSLPLIRQPQAAADGYLGSGTLVAVIDSGVDYTRPAFGSCWAAGEPGGPCKVLYARDFAANDGSLDDDGHGTNVAGIVVGEAPGARIAAYDVFNGPNASSSDILAAINWTIAEQSAATNYVAMNLSLGTEFTYHTSECSADSNPYKSAFANARAVDILPVVAAGNEAYKADGFHDGVAYPACTPGAVRVGAVYDSDVGRRGGNWCIDNTSAADKITCFSQTGPLLSLLAPGAMITAAGYTKGGTSMAAPHVAGAAAILSASNPSAPVAAIQSALETTGPLITDPRNGIVRHRLDLPDAIAAVAGACCRISQVATLSVGAQPTSVALDDARGRLFVAVSGDNVVTMIDTNRNQVVNAFVIGYKPRDVAVDTDTGSVFAVSGDCDYSSCRGAYLSRIEPDTGVVTNVTLATGFDREPLAVAVDTVHDRVYATYNVGGGGEGGGGWSELSVIDIANNSILNTVTVGGWYTLSWATPAGLTVDSVRQRVYVGGGGLQRYDGATLAYQSTASLAAYSVEPDEAAGRLWVGTATSNCCDPNPKATAAALDLIGNGVLTRTYVGTTTRAAVGVAINETNGHVYVVSQFGQPVLSVIDSRTSALLAELALGNSATPGIAVNEATGRIYVANYTSNTVIVYEEPAPVCPGFSGSSIHQIVGSGGDDNLVGTAGPDVICGLGGNDRLEGSGGDDIILGGAGDDEIEGGEGIDTVVESGNFNFNLTDTALIGNGVDSLGGIESARLTGGASDNVIRGSAFTGATTFSGGGGNDSLIGGIGANLLIGGAGNDRLTGGSGADRLLGGSGIDRIRETSAPSGSLVLTNSTLRGLGADTVSGIERATLVGGISYNTLHTSAFSGSVFLYGLGGNDVLVGGPSADRVDGGAGNDRLTGNAGNDTLIGGVGTDRVDGGSGTDSCTGEVKLNCP